MNTNKRFSDEESAPKRGVDGLLDELGRKSAGEDVEFLSVLERRLDEIDRTAAIAKRDKHGRWSSVVKVAAVVAILGIATFAFQQKQQMPDSRTASIAQQVDFATAETGESQDSEMEEEEVIIARAKRPVNELWATPAPTIELLPADASSDESNGELSETVQFAAVSPESKDLSRGGKRRIADRTDFLMDDRVVRVVASGRQPRGATRGSPASADSDASEVFDAVEIARNETETSSVSVQESAAAAEAKREMLAIMDQYDIIDLSGQMPEWASGGDTTETGSKQLVMASRMSTLQAEQEISTITTHIETLDGLSGEKQIDEAVALGVMDSTISMLYPEKKKLEKKRDEFLASGVGLSHPEIRSIDSQIGEVDRLLLRGATAAKDSLQTRLAIAENSLKNLREREVNGNTQDSYANRKAYTQYVEARRRYEQALATVAAAPNTTRSRVRYPALVDNPFQSPEKEPLSTFSIDVDTASYSNVRRMIQSGEPVPPDAVRIEELINYFDYGYANPGDELPFSVNLESAACPWKPEHRLVRVGLKGREVDAESRQALNLVFLVDVSGSMNQERKLPLVQRSLHLLIDALREDDSITIVTYAGREGVALAPTRGTDKAAMHRAVDQLRSSGGTNGEAGIKLAYRLASENFSTGGVNRILLATDGDFNIGVSSTGALRDMVKNEAKRGVFLSVLGFGSDNLNDAMLETITNDGNGTYHYIDSVSEGRKVLVEDLTSTMITIAKDVKLQVEFNPATVGAYRLIGYANRKLPPEAFKDDRVDAGDIGAGHTVTAFYEIVPPGLESASIEDDLKYQVPVPVAPEPRHLTTTGSSELFNVKLRYKEPGGSVSKLIEVPYTHNDRAFGVASSDFQFAASVAAFGLQLRQSPFRGNLSREQVILMAQSAAEADSHRNEFVDLVRNAIVEVVARE